MRTNDRSNGLPTQTLLCIVTLALTAGLFVPHTSDAASAREIYDSSAESVVFVYAGFGEGQGKRGTGTILTEDGLVLTNDHVIRDGRRISDDIIVCLKPPEVTGDVSRDLSDHYAVSVERTDPDRDLALLRFRDPPPGLRPLPVAEHDARPGDSIMVIGHPKDAGLWSASRGIVSSRIQNYGDVVGKHVYQIDAAINPGNSGGPVITIDARIVAVATSGVRMASDGLPASNLHFAVDRTAVLDFLNGLVDLEHARVAARSSSVGSGSTSSSRSSRPEATDAEEGKADDAEGGSEVDPPVPSPTPAESATPPVVESGRTTSSDEREPETPDRRPEPHPRRTSSPPNSPPSGSDRPAPTKEEEPSRTGGEVRSTDRFDEIEWDLRQVRRPYRVTNVDDHFQRVRENAERAFEELDRLLDDDSRRD